MQIGDDGILMRSWSYLHEWDENLPYFLIKMVGLGEHQRFSVPCFMRGACGNFCNMGVNVTNVSTSRATWTIHKDGWLAGLQAIKVRC